MYVYLVWEDRSEHGEDPHLAEVYSSEEKAKEYIQRRAELDGLDEDEESDLYYEKWQVR